MVEVVRWVGFALGVFLFFATAGSLLRTLVVPRGVSSRLSVFVGRRLVRNVFQIIAARFDDYETKDKILSFSGPLSLLAILSVWLMSFFLSFTLIIWPLSGGGFFDAMRESGSSLLTLGFASTSGVGPTAVHFLAATTGLTVVALEIAYLPTLYGAFNRRETLVTLLQSRAGSPAWGIELLIRAHMVNLMEAFPDLYSEWERWAADVAESHTTYPMLNWFRSPHPLRSWVVGLLAVLDSAALLSSLSPQRAPVEARLCLRMGFTCLRDIAAVLDIPYKEDPYPDEPIELTYEEFLGGVHLLEEYGFPMERSAEEAWIDFKGWRVNYESIVYALADAVVAVPGPWSGERSSLPGMSIVPQRPANRRPEDPEDHAEKERSAGWA